MAHNIGEEIAGTYLKTILNCEFVEYNLYTNDVQGEIDVVGVNNVDKKVYVCEVAVHLTTGLQYTKNGRPNNTNKLIEKFEKDIDYANKRFDKSYKKIFMFWSPIVRNQKAGSCNNQLESIIKVKEHLKNKLGVDLELVVNDDFKKCLDELKKYSGEQTEELRTPILRFMQIEEKLSKHLLGKRIPELIVSKF